jgi:tRNA A37 N6-isopentenylltransferase MiaA
LDYDFRCFVVNPMPRDLLFRVIDERSERLIERGLLREVSDLLLTHNLPPDHPITTAIGYRHALQLYASPPARILFSCISCTSLSSHSLSSFWQITTKSFLHFLSTMQNATR